MTRREIERVAAAVKAAQGDMTEASLSLRIGRAVLGTGTAVSWKKWLTATGWPVSIVADMAEEQVRAGKRREAGLPVVQ